MRSRIADLEADAIEAQHEYSKLARKLEEERARCDVSSLTRTLAENIALPTDEIEMFEMYIM